jgi:hypothetical protein
MILRIDLFYLCSVCGTRPPCRLLRVRRGLRDGEQERARPPQARVIAQVPHLSIWKPAESGRDREGQDLVARAVLVGRGPVLAADRLELEATPGANGTMAWKG